MIYSHTQISQYLRCPRLYRYRYLDGWVEKDTRASMVFGRSFEKAIAAYFRSKDCAKAFFDDWAQHRDEGLLYAKNESWDTLYHQAIRLLEKFAQDERVKIALPHENLQKKLLRPVSSDSEFVSYVDAIGELDSEAHIIDWKTTVSRYPESPDGLLSLDSQLIAYSWMSGIRQVAVVVFVRKKFPEIQYLKASITDQQCKEYERLVQQTVAQIESGHFPPHSGIRFPHDSCVSCSHLGLCLNNHDIRDSKLIRKNGADALDWLEQFVD